MTDDESEWYSISDDDQAALNARFSHVFPSESQRREDFEKTLAAAENGDRYQQFRLAGLYKDGRGTPRNLEQATRWYRLSLENIAVEGGSCDLTVDLLADVYRRRIDSGEPLFGEALPWLSLSAWQGNGKSAYFLAECYRNGSDVAENSEEAALWYHTAAGYGHVNAMLRLGRRSLESGDGPTAVESALRWWRMAAEMDAPFGQFLVAQTLLDGRSTAAERREARFWLGRAAASRDPNAIALLEHLGSQSRIWVCRPVSVGSVCDRMLVHLSNNDIQTVLRASDLSTLIPFMLAAPPVTRLAVFSNLSGAASEILRSKMTELGQPTPDAVTNARKTLIATAINILDARTVKKALRFRVLSWIAGMVGLRLVLAQPWP